MLSSDFAAFDGQSPRHRADTYDISRVVEFVPAFLLTTLVITDETSNRQVEVHVDR